ncbi:MAG: hypothetical protein A2Z95_06855 [Gallionellales bacterium GWA2_60_18]|nr:MAG: hypothetical protein A2Z95_06855 [Gallionellales bacterium GWA2_60_18]
MPQPDTTPGRLTPAGIALRYAVFASLWIILSGYLLAVSVSDPVLQSRIEIAKGLLFVAVTGVLVFLLARRLAVPGEPSAAVPPLAPRRRIVIVAVTFLIASGAASLLIMESERQRMLALRAEFSFNAATHAHAIQRNIERALSATYALAALVREGKGDIPDFDKVAGEMLPFYPGAASLQLAPGGIVQRIVPLAGNEKAIGHNLLQDPARNREAFLARDTGKLTLAGPFELIQGGLGAVGRLPVYLDGSNDKSAFWGFTNVLIRFPQGLDEAVLERLTQEGRTYELWRIHPDTGQRQIIASSGGGAPRDPAEFSFELPNGSWTLGIAPVAGWGDPLGLKLKLALGLLFSILMGYLAKLLAELRAHKQSLDMLVAQRTQQLATSEQRFHNISNASGAYLWEVDPDLVYTYVSGQSAQVKGYTPEELLGHRPMEFMPQEDLQPVGEIVKRAIADNVPFRLQHRDITRSGEVLWEEVYGAPFSDGNGKLLGLRGTGMSINARKRAEEELRQSEQRFRDVAMVSADWIWEVDAAGRYTFVSEGVKALLGYMPEEVLGKTPFDFMAPDEARRVAAEFAGIAAAKVPFTDLENTVLGKDGAAHITLTNGTPILDASGELLGYRGVDRDITARRRSEAQIAQNQSLLRATIESTTDAILVVNPEGKIELQNQQFIDLWKIPQEIISAKDDNAALSYVLDQLEDPDGFIHKVRELYASPDAHSFDILKFRDGRIIERYSSPQLLDGNPVGRVWSFRDITARKTAEARVQRLTNLYAALSECNQAIVRCNSEAVLFPQVCRDVVQFGGMKMAWVGLLDEASMKVRPVASYGSGLEYLEDINITADAADPHGRGPVGTAIRENHPVWFQDFLHDPLATPWHEGAVRFGWGAVAALPLHRNGAVVGSFNLYASEVNAFDEDARKLLEEMGTDLSYALDGFERDMKLRLAAEVFERGKEGITITDGKGNIIRVNQAFSAITGYSETEVLGKNPRVLQSGRHDKEFYRVMWDSILSTGHWQGEIWNRRKDGHVYPEWLTISRILGTEGKVEHFIAVFEDITEHKEAEERIQRMAHFDALTGLPNRALLNDRAMHALSMAQRKRKQLALLFVDLDNFKNVNDTLGHHIGDRLLVEVARRIESAIRVEDTVSRQGGDEFIVLLPDADADGAAHVAEKLLEEVSRVFTIDSNELVVTPSIGIAMYPGDGDDFDALSRNADAAMYRAKRDGRNAFRFFTPEMQAHSARILQLENALRHALEREQLWLHYQPQLAMQGGRVIGAEALLRWVHPELGMISPAEFIPVAENSGQILAIGEWVLRTAVRQMKAWMDAGLPPMIIAVNLSAAQFRHSRLPELVTRILDEEELAPQYLELELTESVTMDDPLAAIAVMDDLHARGIRMSIDDFGTGYSSLSYLKRFQVYKLKIDQSFVRDITVDPEDRAIVGAIISLANSLGMQTIAEGVETEDQLAFLREQGCDEVQGFHFSRPVPPGEFEAFVRGRM